MFNSINISFHFKAYIAIFLTVLLGACSHTTDKNLASSIAQKTAVSDHQMMVTLLNRPLTKDHQMMLSLRNSHLEDNQQYVLIKGEKNTDESFQRVTHPYQRQIKDDQNSVLIAPPR